MNHKAISANRPQLAASVMMVPPLNFAYNQQTGQDNEFQQKLALSSEQISDKALSEFQQMVKNLRAHQIEVLLLDPPDSGLETPDAVFPNNWIMTTSTGDAYYFPMYTENRRKEVQVEASSQLFADAGCKIRQAAWLGNPCRQTLALEGTGSMVIDHQNRIIYAAISERCNPQLLDEFTQLIGYEKSVQFETRSQTGKPIYHTNVVMSIGKNIAVLCSESIPDEPQRESVVAQLKSTHQLIEISYQQMAENFCGNILQVLNAKNQPYWVMSRSAYEGFSQSQLKQLEADAPIIVNDIPTIEAIGGGSCRCMLAENFLPREH